MILSTIYAANDVVDTFKELPGMARTVTRPEVTISMAGLQHVLENQLFLGRSYNELFNAPSKSCLH